ncbi:hypothetical protein [Saccharothrix sp. ST-888]|nr:hypothetical protein [Saccharothrix sp. ST-888]
MTEAQRQELARELQTAAIAEGERRRRALRKKFSDAPIPQRTEPIKIGFR